ncbi:hypothetical protein DdX_13658 [Ditylenchus destructor]|uniref:Uncharacterized protein n=1 Tax=Ditylenchus destructor TaxID=166010 RepID=A0AAD4MY90_9BILA|nr:hypothetical protein DdX_13658 [Ditylenchus destructor]
MGEQGEEARPNLAVAAAETQLKTRSPDSEVKRQPSRLPTHSKFPQRRFSAMGNLHPPLSVSKLNINTKLQLL